MTYLASQASPDRLSSTFAANSSHTRGYKNRRNLATSSRSSAGEIALSQQQRKPEEEQPYQVEADRSTTLPEVDGGKSADILMDDDDQVSSHADADEVPVRRRESEVSLFVDNTSTNHEK
jgi:hypothetical protein